MFALLNSTSFKYLVPLLIFYILIIVFNFAFKVWVKKQPKDERRVFRKSFGDFAEACFWVGLLGLMYLWARRNSVYFLSMEFLHVINALVLAGFLGIGIKRYDKLRSK